MPLEPLFVLILPSRATRRLSWADTAASTFGRMFGARTPPLPSAVHLLAPLLWPLPHGAQARLRNFTPFAFFNNILRIPFAPRKSLAGFTAATITGALIAGTFWGTAGPLGVDHPAWSWGVGPLGNWLGLALVSVVAGVVSGVAEALGMSNLASGDHVPWANHLW